MTVEEIKKELRKNLTEQSLEFAIESGVFKEEVLHYFATDCLERTFQESYKPIEETDLRFILLRTKREWLKKERTDEELEQAVEAIRVISKTLGDTTAIHAGDKEPLWAAKRAAYWSAYSIGASTSTWSKLWHRERAWQCKRLAWWLELSEITEDFSNAYQSDDKNPLPPPKEASLDFPLLPSFEEEQQSKKKR